MFGRGFRISFPVCKNTEIRLVFTFDKKYRLSEQTTGHNIKEICWLTSSQDMLYSAKTVRQRAAILKGQRSKTLTGKPEAWTAMNQLYKCNYPNISCMLYTVLSMAEIGCVMSVLMLKLYWTHANMLLHMNCNTQRIHWWCHNSFVYPSEEESYKSDAADREEGMIPQWWKERDLQRKRGTKQHKITESITELSPLQILSIVSCENQS